jgi:4-aminobutyrate aminotransferase
VAAGIRRAHDALASLMDRNEAIGDLRSLGLLVGVELVADRERREPAPAVADRVLNGMREKTRPHRHDRPRRQRP